VESDAGPGLLELVFLDLFDTSSAGDVEEPSLFEELAVHVCRCTFSGRYV